MTPEQALSFIAEILGEAIIPLKLYPKVQGALSVVEQAIKVKPPVPPEDK